jgi:outer membrane protein OmpA-like peptidoglycan-associated protein
MKMIPGLPSIRSAPLALLACLIISACQTPPVPVQPTATTTEVRTTVLKSLGFVKQADSWDLSLGVKLLFDTDVDRLTDEGREALRSMARTFREVGIDRIRIEGHTDNVGAARYNQELSIRRADSVARELVQAGIPAHSIQRIGLGYSKPVADNATVDGRAQNRRVVITVRAD